MENNNISLIGEILDAFEFSHEVYGEKFYKTRIKCERTSGVYDILPVIVSDRVIDPTTNLQGKSYIVCGSTRTHNLDGHLIISVFADAMGEDNDDTTNTNMLYLNGHICKKSHYRMTPKGRVVCDVMLAVNRPYGKSDYIPCLFWGRAAKYVDGLDIGANIDLRGRLQSREYNKNDTTNTAYEVSVISFETIR